MSCVREQKEHFYARNKSQTSTEHNPFKCVRWHSLYLSIFLAVYCQKKEKEENIFPLTQAHQPFNGETFVMYIF